MFPQRGGVRRVHLGDHDVRVGVLGLMDELAEVRGSGGKLRPVGDRVPVLGGLALPQRAHRRAVLRRVGEQGDPLVVGHQIGGLEVDGALLHLVDVDVVRVFQPAAFALNHARVGVSDDSAGMCSCSATTDNGMVSGGVTEPSRAAALSSMISERPVAITWVGSDLLSLITSFNSRLAPPTVTPPALLMSATACS